MSTPAAAATSNTSDESVTLVVNGSAVRVSMPTLARIRSALMRDAAAEEEPPIPAPRGGRGTHRNPAYHALRNMSATEDTMRMKLIAEIEAKRRSPPDACSAEAKRARRQHRRRVSDCRLAATAATAAGGRRIHSSHSLRFRLQNSSCDCDNTLTQR